MELLLWCEHRTTLARLEGAALLPAPVRGLAFNSFSAEHIAGLREAA